MSYTLLRYTTLTFKTLYQVLFYPDQPIVIIRNGTILVIKKLFLRHNRVDYLPGELNPQPRLEVWNAIQLRQKDMRQLQDLNL